MKYATELSGMLIRKWFWQEKSISETRAHLRDMLERNIGPLNNEA